MDGMNQTIRLSQRVFDGSEYFFRVFPTGLV